MLRVMPAKSLTNGCCTERFDIDRNSVGWQRPLRNLCNAASSHVTHVCAMDSRGETKLKVCEQASDFQTLMSRNAIVTDVRRARERRFRTSHAVQNLAFRRWHRGEQTSGELQICWLANLRFPSDWTNT